MMTNGSAWRLMQEMTLEELGEIAGRMGYGFEEEMARSMLRIRLHPELQEKRQSVLRSSGREAATEEA